jgi:predicted RNA-binding protein with PUA-like domain
VTSYLLKTEPTTYSFDDLVREKATIWDGVANAQALMVLHGMKRGDEVLIYHSGKERAIVGVAKVARGPRPDPALDDPRRVVVEIRAVRRLATPVTLAAIKATPGLAELALVRQGRLSCMPVSPGHRRLLSRLGVD